MKITTLSLKSLELGIAGFILFVSSSSSCLGANLSVQDVIEGIDARQLKVRDIEVLYSITDKNESRFYEKINKDFERRKANAAEDEKVELGVPKGKSFDSISINAFHIFSHENKKAFETYVTSNNTRSLETKAVYDGEILRFVNVPQLNGVVERKLPGEIIRFPTIPKILGLENIALADYLRSPEIKSAIKNERLEGGDFIVDIIVQRVNTVGPEMQIEVTTEHLFSINTQKDFWPIKIEKYFQITNTKTGEMARILNKKIDITNFVEKNGVYYPTMIKEREFDYESTYLPPSLVPKFSDPILMTSREVIVEKININEGMSESVFDFEFPSGTRYHDAISGMGMIVGAGPDELAQYMAESAEALPVSEYTRKEAEKILRLQKQGKIEEAEALRRSIIQGKTDQDSISPQFSNSTSKITKTKITKELSQNNIPIVEKKIINKEKNIHFAYYLLVALACLCVGYYVTIIRGGKGGKGGND